MMKKQTKERKGVTVVLLVLMLVVLLGMAAFAVDLGRMYLTRSQLQTAVDAGALAAGVQLRSDTNDLNAAIEAGKDYVRRNRVGAFVTVPEEAIIVEAGDWNSETRVFTVGSPTPDAIRVRGQLDREPFFFSRALGRKTFSLPQSAIVQGGGSPQDILLLLDLSTSMNSNSRIEALRVAAPVFVDVIEEMGNDDRIGVIGYGAQASKYDPEKEGNNGELYLDAPSELMPGDDFYAVTEADLTDDYDHLRDNVLSDDNLEAGKYGGQTPTGAGIRDAAHYLTVNARDDVDRIIVLMSDGHANRPSGNGAGYARSMAVYAADNDITIYTISLGHGADAELLEDIAELTGGQHFSASGPSGDLTSALVIAFTKVANAIKRTHLVQ